MCAQRVFPQASGMMRHSLSLPPLLVLEERHAQVGQHDVDEHAPVSRHSAGVSAGVSLGKDLGRSAYISEPNTGTLGCKLEGRARKYASDFRRVRFGSFSHISPVSGADVGLTRLSYWASTDRGSMRSEII